MRDPELDAALGAGARALERDKPLAAVARELILRAAEQLKPKDDEVERWLQESGAQRATRSTAAALETARNLQPYEPLDPRPMSEILDEIREDRI